MICCFGFVDKKASRMGQFIITLGISDENNLETNTRYSPSILPFNIRANCLFAFDVNPPQNGASIAFHFISFHLIEEEKLRNNQPTHNTKNAMQNAT